MKICNCCLVAKKDDQFYKRKYRDGATSGNCIDCEKEYRRQHYIDNKEKYLVKARRNEEKYRKELLNFLLSYFKENPCVDCGERDPVVLEFDHVRGEKLTEVSVLMARQHNLKKIKNEISKCDVRCANCHRRRTAKQLGWRKFFVPVAQQTEQFATND